MPHPKSHQDCRDDKQQGKRGRAWKIEHDDVLRIADGCIVGTALKVDGDTWNPVDPDRAAEFMRLARAARGGR